MVSVSSTISDCRISSMTSSKVTMPIVSLFTPESTLCTKAICDEPEKKKHIKSRHVRTNVESLSDVFTYNFNLKMSRNIVK